LGALFIAALVGLCMWDAARPLPGSVLLPIALLLSILAADEIWALATARGLRPCRTTTLLGVALVVGSNAIAVYWPQAGADCARCALATRIGWPMLAAVLALMLSLLVEIGRYERPGESIANLGATSFALLYAGGLITAVVHLRLIGGDMGLLPLISLVAVVKACDVGAYTFGRLFGRHKMAPVISPGKTLEGAAGGIVWATVASWVTFRAFGIPIEETGAGGYGWLIYGGIVGLAGMFGDLAESLLKRDAGRKDSSAWMPGFGGVLDVLDSILFAAPVAFILWAAGIVRA
jgi:phosphatidate cytidylyltransferase